MGVRLQHAGVPVRSFAMPKSRPHRYSIEIKDAKGQSVRFTAADWDKDNLRVVVARILRLDGVIEPLSFSEPGSPPSKEYRKSKDG
jgi:hypothetical protein